MRQVEFRGKRIDNGEWAHGDLEYSRITNAAFIHTYNQDTKEYAGQLRVDPDTVGQFTGVYDPNGKGVWEGDIIGYKDSGTDEVSMFGVVRWHKEGCFYIGDERKDAAMESSGANVGYMMPSHKTLIVIGNIHDNPELIKTEKQ